MKRIIAVWIVILMVMGGMIGFANLSTDAEVGNGDAGIRYASQSKSGLTAHDPIYINGNSDFTSANGVTSGSGTASNPYIIENWDINAGSANGIHIGNTDVYFIIRDCVIHDGKSNIYYGIHFYDVINGKIGIVTSYNNYYGIFLYDSSNNQITNCEVYNNNWCGIYLDSSSNNIITNCYVYNNNHDGIHLYYSSDNNQITNCEVYNNDDGIFLYDSTNNKIHYCNIYSNTDYGVYGSTVNATYNWWGSANGPSGVGPGSGDVVSDNVLYDPWLTEPNPSAGVQIYPTSSDSGLLGGIGWIVWGGIILFIAIIPLCAGVYFLRKKLLGKVPKIPYETVTTQQSLPMQPLEAQRSHTIQVQCMHCGQINAIIPGQESFICIKCGVKSVRKIKS